LVGGGCSVPIGVYARVEGDTMTLAAIVFEEAGKLRQGSVTMSAKAPSDAAEVLYRRIYAEDR
jgi:porphobilinogen deaminase